MNSDNIRIVLVEPTHPGNIGAVARAMANMELDRLFLVAPQQFPSAEASARAAGADWILDGAQVHANLADAVADCELLIGLSARARSIDWPQLTPGDAARRATRLEDELRALGYLLEPPPDSPAGP